MRIVKESPEWCEAYHSDTFLHELLFVMISAELALLVLLVNLSLTKRSIGFVLSQLLG